MSVIIIIRLSNPADSEKVHLSQCNNFEDIQQCKLNKHFLYTENIRIFTRRQ